MKKLGVIILAVLIAVITFTLKAFGFVKFEVPPLVEGPKIMFFVELPKMMHDFPSVLQMPDGSYGFPVTITVISTWCIMLFTIFLLRWGSKNLEIIPGKKQAFFETIYVFLEDLINPLLGSWTKKYFSYISTLFIFILFSNLTSFFPIPGFSFGDGLLKISPALRTPTADLNTTVGLAFLTTYSFISAKFKSAGFLGFIKGLFEPMPIMFPINLAGEFAKPTNISIRLFGNMFAGAIILGLIYKTAPALVPAPLHLYFDLFSGVVQSFVFIMLSMVYIQGSVAGTEYSE